MGKLKYLVILLVAALSAFGCLALYLLVGCVYSGTEFSPDDFSVRDFSYRYDRFTGSVIGGRDLSPGDTYLMPDLVGDGYIKPVFKKEKTWHLIEDNGHYFREHSTDSDARFLIDFLELKEENYENHWTVWNSNNPKLATILWPLIAEMARDHAYLVVGDVLTFVIDFDTTEQKNFSADLHREVAKAYLKLGQIDFENDQLEPAKLRVSKSIKYDSTDEAKALLNRITDGLESAVDPSVSPEAVLPEAKLESSLSDH